MLRGRVMLHEVKDKEALGVAGASEPPSPFPSDAPARCGWLRILLLLALVAGTIGGGPAWAELVILRGGDVVRAKAHRLEDAGSKIQLDLRSGGLLTLSIDRVERIVDDEVPDDSSTPSFPVPIHFASGQAVPSTPYGNLIYQLARDHSLNPALVAAVVHVESNFDPSALSNKGARGLLQLMPATAARFGVAESQLYDPRHNLEAGVTYLAWLVKRFEGDLPRVLAAYNAGEAMVKRYGGIPPFRETRNYIRRVYASLGAGTAPALAGK